MVSFFISSRLQRQPIYDALAVQDGIHLPKAETRHLQRERQVARVMRTATESLPSELTVRDAWERIRSGESQTWLVTDRQRLVGVINLSTLAREIAGGCRQAKVG